jgi:hypothetical protein
MSLSRYLFEYLSSDDPIEGPSGDPFAEPQTVGNMTVKNRVEARDKLRSIVGDAIYWNRQPEDILAMMGETRHTAILTRTVDSEQSYGLLSELPCPLELLRCDLYASGTNGVDRADVLSDLLYLTVSAFRDGLWGSRLIDSCFVDSRASNAFAPRDGSDRWIFNPTIDLQVYHRGPVANQWSTT